MKSGKFTLQFVTLAALVAATSYPSLAGILFSDQVIETMMENQGADAAYLGRVFGADPTSIIQFQSSVDTTNGTFTYSTDPGSTYLGRSLSIVATGVFDASTNMWSLETDGSLGGSSWIQDGSGGFTAVAAAAAAGGAAKSPPSSVGGFDWKIPIGPGLFLDFHSIVDVTPRQDDPNTGDSKGSYKFTINDKVITSGSTGNDVIKLTAKDHMWHDAVYFDPGTNISPFIVTSDGSNSLDGGFGSFSVQIAPVPEPASFCFIGAGLVLLARVRRRIGRN